MRWRGALAVAAVLLGPGCGRIGFEPAVDAPAIPAPVARYLFDDDPGDGVEDVTGNGHTGTCGACPTRVAAIDDAGYQFSGQMIRVPYTPALSAAGGLSAAAWVRTDATGATGCIAGKPVGTTIHNTWQLCVGANLQLLACVDDVAGCASSPLAFVVGAWRHLVLTFDGTTMRAWVGGQRVIEAPRQLTVDDQDLLVGGDLDNGTPAAPFIGVVDDLRIWDRALTDEEVAQLVRP